MHGKLFVIEGVDGSGKATQTARLYDALTASGQNVGKVEFPNYASPSSSLIKMYLNGDFGEAAGAVNPFVASTFYAVDRFATFRTEWEAFYQAGGILLADRYTTSNMIHQGSKIADPQERDAYFKWLLDFEYRLFGLPQPDAVLFLDMPPACSRALRQSRGTLKADLKQDIHEADNAYLLSSYENALSIARAYHWHIIACAEADGSVRSIDAIAQDVWQMIAPYLAN